MTHSGPTVPDPATATGNDAEIAAAFADTYRMLNNRIGAFVHLPFSSLDKTDAPEAA